MPKVQCMNKVAATLVRHINIMSHRERTTFNRFQYLSSGSLFFLLL